MAWCGAVRVPAVHRLPHGRYAWAPSLLGWAQGGPSYPALQRNGRYNEKSRLATAF